MPERFKVVCTMQGAIQVLGFTLLYFTADMTVICSVGSINSRLVCLCLSVCLCVCLSVFLCTLVFVCVMISTESELNTAQHPTSG